jgi:hypothetical protein
MQIVSFLSLWISQIKTMDMRHRDRFSTYA